MFFNRAENFMSVLTPYTYLPYNVLKCVHWRLSVQSVSEKLFEKRSFQPRF